VGARVALRTLNTTEKLRSRFLPETVLPANDEFYRQPSDLQAHRPGDVFDVRTIQARSFRRPIKADAWQVKFRSTGMNGEAVAGFTTLLVPHQPFDGAVRPLLSYQPALDSLSATADPSYTLRHGDYGELPLVNMALKRGWAVVTTDYNGPTQAFGALPLAGRFILDAIRAVLVLESNEFDDATPIGLWGYSGGAQATLWAAEQHGTYASDLNIVGIAAGGAGVDLATSPEMFDGGNFLSGIPFGSVVGLSRAFPTIDLISVLTPEGRAMADAAADMRVEQLMMSFPFIRLSDHLTVTGVFEIPGMRGALEVIRLGKATPKAPMYVYHAIRDQYPAVEDVDKLVEKYRGEGVDITYKRFRFGKHAIVAITGVRSSLRFLDERFSSPVTSPHG
jgi:pimeloyl-ACP methyl ester carboxylesterase